MLDKVGLKKENSIWKQGIETWNDFLATEVKGISKTRKPEYDRIIRLAKLNLDYENTLHFRETLPSSEMWRIYPEFKDKTAYLDIETSGYYITVVGIYNGYEVKHFVKGFNLNKEALLRELYKYKVLVTFNGSSFDIPMLERFLRHKIRIAHIDLRHVCARIGLKGGLKSIEKQLCIKRMKEVDGMTGEQGVYCWEIFQHTGKKEYLDLLLKYNAEDVLNLKPLAEYAVKELWKKTRGAIIK
ncbi:MAG: ribonuclease H-like domain-containing protein [Nanoarchaeota archaeon]|nr:ribonuclease H-like domain-containing protein [Nanoarchaeota archaeon]